MKTIKLLIVFLFVASSLMAQSLGGDVYFKKDLWKLLTTTTISPVSSTYGTSALFSSLTDGTDTYKMLVSSDKWTLQNDAGSPYDIMQADSIGSFVWNGTTTGTSAWGRSFILRNNNNGDSFNTSIIYEPGAAGGSGILYGSYINFYQYGSINTDLWLNVASTSYNYKVTVGTTTDLFNINGTTKNATFYGNLESTTLTVGGGSAISKFVTASRVYDCGSIAAGVDSVFTITATGAVAGNPVQVGVSVAAEATLIITAECTTNDAVTVRISNHGLVAAVDPASRTYKVIVTNF